MVISASRRTDIPNYHADWFLKRIREGFLYVRNPMNAHQISRIDLSPEVVDCIVFWTKNPTPLMEHLDELKDYQYYFQFTITGCGKDVEPGVPDKKQVVIPAFQELSRRLGKKRMIWRYDPIFLSGKYTPEYHLRAFEEIAAKLEGCTEKAVISFVDFYAKTQRNTAELGIRGLSEQEMVEFAQRMVLIAGRHGMAVESCAEAIDLSSVGVQHGSCIDKRLIEELLGCKLTIGKDKNQRQECGCVESVEIGAYNTCRNGCRYCYANFNDARVKEHFGLYDVDSPLLCGVLGPEDKITERSVRSLKEKQISLFDA